jgi:hypothetical protein
MTGSFKLISGVQIFKRCMLINKVRNLHGQKESALKYNITCMFSIQCGWFEHNQETMYAPFFYILYLELHDGFWLNSSLRVLR